MKHLAHALAILARAQTELEADYNASMAKAVSKVEKEFALRLRLIRDARQAVQARFAQREALLEDYFGELKATTPPKTNVRLRKSLRRERERKSKYAR